MLCVCVCDTLGSKIFNYKICENKMSNFFLNEFVKDQCALCIDRYIFYFFTQRDEVYISFPFLSQVLYCHRAPATQKSMRASSSTVVCQ